MDGRTFRNAMGKFATGVTVVTTKNGDEVHGMTANAFMSVSMDPQLICVSVGHNASMHNKIKDSGKFAVKEGGEPLTFFGGKYCGLNREVEVD